MPLPEDGENSWPGNVYCYSEPEEVQTHISNQTELSNYLHNLQMHFNTYISDRQNSEKSGDSVINIFGAVRPHASKFWIQHPGVYNDELYRPLKASLEKQALPSLNGGVLAFVLVNTVPNIPDESIEFEIVFPNEWTEATENSKKEMSVTEVLDAIWPLSVH